MLVSMRGRVVSHSGGFGDEIQAGFAPLPSPASLPPLTPVHCEPGTRWQPQESWLYVHWFILRRLYPKIHHQALLLPESVDGGLWLNFTGSLVQTSGFSCGGVIWNKTSLLDTLSLSPLSWPVVPSELRVKPGPAGGLFLCGLKMVLY